MPPWRGGQPGKNFRNIIILIFLIFRPQQKHWGPKWGGMCGDVSEARM